MSIWVELKNINVFRIKDMGENFNAFYLSVSATVNVIWL